MRGIGGHRLAKGVDRGVAIEVVAEPQATGAKRRGRGWVGATAIDPSSLPDGAWPERTDRRQHGGAECHDRRPKPGSYPTDPIRVVRVIRGSSRHIRL